MYYYVISFALSTPMAIGLIVSFIFRAYIIISFIYYVCIIAPALISHPFTNMHQQDAREAMRVVFSVLTKRICMHKTKFLMNIFKYCLKIILNSMNLQIATQLIIMFNF